MTTGSTGPSEFTGAIVGSTDKAMRRLRLSAPHPGQLLDYRQRADRAVLAGQHQHGAHLPELGAAAVAAAMTPQVEVHDLKVLLQRPRKRLDRHVIQTGTAVDRHNDWAIPNRPARGEG